MIKVLGKFEVSPPKVQGEMRIQLLALIAAARRMAEYQANGEVPRNWLAQQLYPEGYDQKRKQARDSLAELVNGLETNFHEIWSHNHRDYLGFNKYESNIYNLKVDIDEFYAALSRQDLQGAIELWRGPLLAELRPDWQGQDWYKQLRADLDYRYLKALRQLAQRQLRMCADAQTRGFSPEVVEAFRQKGLDLLTRASDYATEIKEAQIETELIIQIAVRIKGLLETLQQDVHTLPPDTPPTNLPQQLTSFIGRERKIVVKSLLGSTRLLTLTGSGGCGKTRLALEIGTDLLEEYPDGVWLVELAALTAPALTPQTVAQTLGVQEQPVEVQGQLSLTPEQALISHLRTKRLLLLLDNCEHLLPGCAALAAALLRSCPHIRILITSREPLNVAGELTYQVPSLSLPDLKQTRSPESLNQYEAVQLFKERALFHKPDFQVTNLNAYALAQLCCRLDGNPLALELAAARARSLSVGEINDRLDDRFRLLTGGIRAALPRQQTLRALIDWSYNLLTEPEQMFFPRLSVFAGGWTLKAAETVCCSNDIKDRDILDLLKSLTDKSLILAQTQNAPTRYILLETIQHYAHERLEESGECPFARAKHGDFFLALAEESKSKIEEPNTEEAEQTKWLSNLKAEHDNLRQALAFYIEDMHPSSNSAEKGLRLGAALQPFWETSGGMSEGRRWLSELLAHPRGQEPTEARAAALSSAGGLAILQGDYEQARKLYEQSLLIRREIGDRFGLAKSLGNLGMLEYELGNDDRARELQEESLAIRRELGDKSQIAISLFNLGNLVQEQEDYIRASELYKESRTLYEEAKDTWSGTYVDINWGVMVTKQEDFPKAHSLLRSLQTLLAFDDDRGVAFGLEAFANLAFKEGDMARCSILWGAAAALREKVASPLPLVEAEKLEKDKAIVKNVLGEDAFGEFIAQGRAMPSDLATAFALSDGEEQQNK